MTVLLATTLGCIPALFMLICTSVGLGVEVPTSISGALQHFAAGILLCTIGTELLPIMVEATGLTQNIASFVGFFLGIGVLLLMDVLAEFLFPHHDLDEGTDDSDCEEDDENGEKQQQKSQQSQQQYQSYKLEKQESIVSAASSIPSLRRRNSLSSLAKALIQPQKEPSGTNNSVQSGSASAAIIPPSPVTEEAKPLISTVSYETSQDQRRRARPFPLAFIATIGVDSFMDGLLIGIACAAGQSASFMMSVSLTVEMSFLGFTLATALYGYPLKQSLWAVLFGPVTLVLGAAAGGILAATLSHSPVLLVGMLSFGASALLFMVAEELLLEAHENGNEHVWWVDLQLYVGFFVSILINKAIPDE